MKDLLRGSRLWRAIVMLAVPVFHFFWEHVANRSAKRLYGESSLGPGPPMLRQESLLIFRGNKEYAELAESIQRQIPESAKRENRERLLGADDERAFIGDLLPHCSDALKVEILAFSLSLEVLAVVSAYFGFVPRIGSISLMHNIVRPGSTQEGSKEWHRDTQNYRSFNVFMCVSDVDGESGPYSVVSAADIPVNAMIPIFRESESDGWRKSRVPDAVMDACVPKDRQQVLIGPAGTTAFVDPSSVYHKGGFCTSKERIMLQISYITATLEPRSGIIEQLGLEGSTAVDGLLGSKEAVYATSGFLEASASVNPRNLSYVFGKKILSYHMHRVGDTQPAGVFRC